MNAPTHHTPHHDDIDDPFARRLRSRLDAEVRDLPDAGGPDAAVSRGRARRRNRRAILASAAVFAVVAASSQAFTGDPGEADLATAPQGVEIDESLTFDWTVTDDGLSMANQYTAGDAGLYALSTGAGTRDEDFPEGDAPRAMYRLADDGTWVPIPLEGDDPNVAVVSDRGGSLYALSTGTATSSGGSPLGSISTDGGSTWSSVPLETATAPNDSVSWGLWYQLDLASTADHTLAVVTGHVQVPYQDLFPELDAPNHDLTTEFTDDGIDLVRMSDNGPEEADPDGTQPDEPAATPAGADDVVRTVRWSDLGISGAEDLTIQRWTYAVENGSWTEISTPAAATPASGTYINLDAVGDQFLLSIESYTDDEDSTIEAYRSRDGEEWVSVGRPGYGQLLPAGDSLLYLGHGADGDTTDMVQLSRNLGATWEPLDLAALDPSLGDMPDDSYVLHASAGPLGVAVLVVRAEEQPQPPKMLFSTDLQKWSVTDLAEVVPAGGYTGDVIVGTDRVVVLGHTNAGEPGSPERSATMVGVPRRT